MAENTAQAGADLCTNCGLCCTGLIFPRVGVKPTDEFVYLHPDVELKVTGPGKKSMALPCQFLKDMLCSIYTDRPRNCRAYTCDLNQCVVNGADEYDNALAVIQNLNRLIDEIDPVLVELTGEDFRAIGFQEFCKSFAGDASQRLFEGEALTAIEQKFIPLAFDIIKTADRFLRKTKRLAEFANLMVAKDQWNGREESRS